MIEKMKKVGILSSQSGKKQLLDGLRDLGVLHIAEKNSPNQEETERFSELTRVQMVLSEYPEVSEAKKNMKESEFELLHKSIVKALDDKKRISEEVSKLTLSAEALSLWGNFEPSDLKVLRDAGYELHFYRMGKKEYQSLLQAEDISFVSLKSVEKMNTVAVLGKPLDKSWSCIEFMPPEEGLEKIQSEISRKKADLETCERTIKEASAYLPCYKDAILKAKNDLLYSSVNNTAQSDGGVVFLEGYIPDEDISCFKEVAKKNTWAYVIADVEEDDEKVPTKVRYNKVTSLMKPIFNILGTVPGYREYDISFWFLCFFSLFFAMIIGDAGYGALFLLTAVGLHVKSKKMSDVVLLLYVLSICNIIWGALTGTWFGLEGAMNVSFLKKLVIPSIANYPEYFGITQVAAQNNVMKFCFIIGTVQLSLACILNVKTKLGKKDLSLVADIGWLIAINALYYIVLLLVIGETVNTKLCFMCVIAGFLLVVCFGGMAPGLSFSKGLKAGLGNAFTTFLNTISAFGNVMSYIRLFAVGMASLAIAQSFNNMAGSLSGALKVAGVLIFIIGHALNLVMGLLSVVVHGVRLNLLEFSGQLGMEWSGIQYEPFKRIKN